MTRATVPSPAAPEPGSVRGAARRFAVLLAFALAGAPALADSGSPELCLAQSFGGQFNAESASVALFGRAPAWTRASRLEYSGGIVGGTGSSRLFVFAGPVWHVSDCRQRLYAEFSFGGTLLDGSRIDGRELGGNVHFRSALALGMRLGRHDRTRVALRLSHISNGGLHESNPGIDFIGLSITAAP